MAPENTDPAGPAPTFGESRVMVVYKDDPAQQAIIQSIRERGASWIDALEDLKTWPNMLSWEQARLYALAQTTVEEAVMWSIKALTK